MSELRLVASDETIKRLMTAASDDNEYTQLLRQIAAGWPESPSDLPPNLRAYHTFSEELSSNNGLVFKRHRLVVPLPMCADILDRLHVHDARTDVNGCLRCARETVFWPGITADFSVFIVCVKSARKPGLVPTKASSSPAATKSTKSNSAKRKNNTDPLPVDL